MTALQEGEAENPGGMPFSNLSAACITAASGWLILAYFSALELGWFARTAARVASLFIGSGIRQDPAGWSFYSGNLEVLVSSACSGTGFFIILATLLSLQLCRPGWRMLAGCAFSIGLAFLAAPLINGLRITLVAELHRWILPQIPLSAHAFIHMLAGAAVFLPVLIFINLLIERYAGKPKFPT